MKKSASNIILVVILIIGLSLMLYPSVANYWNRHKTTRSVATYTELVTKMDDESYKQVLEEARAHNRDLLNRRSEFLLSDEQREVYNALLNIGSTSIMGYIEIPSIDVSLPIYHGTDESVLQVAVGHLEWSSLPVGGESTHCVLSGHRGLPSARLFTDLDQLVVGDYFMLNVLDQILTYEVDQIRIVEPDETDELLIQEGKDLCTLITCTPYGINSHRMLVRGHRVDNMENAQDVRVTADAVIVEKLVVVPFVLTPILLLMLLWLLFAPAKKKK